MPCNWKTDFARSIPIVVISFMRTGPEINIAAGEPDQFGGPQARLDGETEQSRVAPSGPGRPVRCGQQGVDLCFGQPGHQPPLEALRWDGQNPLDGGGLFEVAQGSIAEQGSDRGQSCIAGAHAVLSFVLEVKEETLPAPRIMPNPTQQT